MLLFRGPEICAAQRRGGVSATGANRSAWLIPWLVDFSAFLVIFAVGRDVAESGGDMVTLGVLGALFSAGLGAASLVGGRLSDRFGRRRMIMAGLTLHLLFSVTAAARLYPLAYVVGGVSAGMVYPAFIAWMTRGRQASGARSAMSHTLILFCVSWNLGLLSGQLFGGWLFAFDRLVPIAGSFILTIICMGVVSLNGLHPTAKVVERVVTVDDDLRHRALAASFARLSRVANLGGAFSMSMIIYLFPKLAVETGIPSDVHGMLLAGMRMVIVALYLLMHLTSIWHFRLVTAVTSQCLAAAGLLLLVVAPNLLTITVALAAIAQVQGYNYFAGLYYSTAGSTDEQRGASSGLHEATLSAGFVAGSLAGGLVGHFAGVRAPYILAAAVMLALAAVQVVMVVRRPREGAMVSLETQ
jgi:DHA1 family multidrug resistance protein-like MFS transporter